MKSRIRTEVSTTARAARSTQTGDWRRDFLIITTMTKMLPEIGDYTVSEKRNATYGFWHMFWGPGTIFYFDLWYSHNMSMKLLEVTLGPRPPIPTVEHLI